jgi:uncharacterized membrane protein YgcG
MGTHKNSSPLFLPRGDATTGSLGITGTAQEGGAPALFTLPYVDPTNGRLVMDAATFIGSLLANHEQLLGTLTPAQLGKTKTLAHAALSQLSVDEYKADVTEHTTRWKKYLIFQKKLESVQKYRETHLLTYQHTEGLRLRQQYERCKTNQQRGLFALWNSNGTNSNNNYGAIRAATHGSGSSGSNATHMSSGGGSASGGSGNSLTMKVSCGDARGIALIHPNENVGQFIRRAFTESLRKQIQPGHEVWAFIEGGPRMREDLPMNQYEVRLIGGIKLIMTPNTQPQLDSDDSTAGGGGGGGGGGSGGGGDGGTNGPDDDFADTPLLQPPPPFLQQQQQEQHQSPHSPPHMPAAWASRQRPRSPDKQ